MGWPAGKPLQCFSYKRVVRFLCRIAFIFHFPLFANFSTVHARLHADNSPSSVDKRTTVNENTLYYRLKNVAYLNNAESRV